MYFQVERLNDGRSPNFEFTMLRESYNLIKELKTQQRTQLNAIEANLKRINKEMTEIKKDIKTLKDGEKITYH